MNLKGRRKEDEEVYDEIWNRYCQSGLDDGDYECKFNLLLSQSSAGGSGKCEKAPPILMSFCPSEHLAEYLVQNEVIAQDEKELYSFGINHGFMMLLNVITTALIGLALGMLWQSLVFLISYMPLRMFAGGYHAKTQRGCYCASVLMVVAVLLIVKFVPWTSILCVAVLFVAGSVVLWRAPVESKNKPLDEEERRVYRKRARRILAIEITVALCLLWAGVLQGAACVVITIGTMCIMLMFGDILKNDYPVSS